jgi:hypothetical protein
MDHLQLLFIRIFLCTSLAATLAWIADYSRDRWWRNIIGRNLATKTVIIALLLLVSLLSAFFRLTPGFIYWLRWADIVLLASIGPVMVWRMVVFRKVAGAAVRCPAGHWAASGANYCQECGIPMPGGPGAGRPLADS